MLEIVDFVGKTNVRHRKNKLKTVWRYLPLLQPSCLIFLFGVFLFLLFLFFENSFEQCIGFVRENVACATKYLCGFFGGGFLVTISRKLFKCQI